MVFSNRNKVVCFGIFLALTMGVSTPMAKAAATEAKGSDDCYLSDGRPYQCKRIDVPLVHENPDGKKISLFYGVIENEVQNQPEDPIFLLAGGPGQSAIDAFLPLASTFKAMFGNRNVYVVDQRGLGKSTPLGCEPIEDITLDSFPVDTQFITDQLKKCFQAVDNSPQYFTTDDFIQDLELLRQQEGLDKVVLYGGSYGTRVAARYAMLKPEAISQLILEGYAGLNLILYKHFEQDVKDAMKQVEKRCHQVESCKTEYPNLMNDFEAITASLPKMISIRHPLTLEKLKYQLEPEVFFGWAMSFLYSPTTQNIFPLALKKALEDNDFSVFVGMSANQPPAGVDAMLYYAVACYEDYPDLKPIETLAPITQAMVKPMAEICETLPKRSLAQDFRRYKETKIPTLFISGHSDPVTPPRNVTKIMENFKGAQHLELDHYAHTFSFSLKCARQTVKSFLDGEYNNTCPSDLPTLSIFKTPMGY